MKKQIFVLISVIIVFMMTFTACNSSKEDSGAQMMGMSAQNYNDTTNGEQSYAPASDGKDAMANPQTSGEGVGDNSTISIPDQSRKLIKNVDMNIETKEYDKLTEALAKKITEVNGYVENSEINGNSYNDRSTRSSSIIVRVPKAKLNEFVSSVSALGNVTRKTERVQDVTLQYVDVESHKKALLVEQERLIAIMEKATKLEDIITLENRLSEVRYQIQSYESQLRTYDNLVDYSTVTINYKEVERITPVPTAKKSFWSKMSTGFTESLSNVWDGLQSFVIKLVTSLPYLIVVAVIVIIIVYIALKVTKSTKIKQKLLRPSNQANPIETTKEETKEEKKE